MPSSLISSMPTHPKAPRVHGGPDALGVPRFDFSTNSNACGPCPQALTAVQAADVTRYPDASYTTLRQQLGDFHGVPAWRVVLAGSASEFIFRITAWVAQQNWSNSRVHLPRHSYGDYAQAAQAWGLSVTPDLDAAQLVWACEPSSPLGQAHAVWPQWLVQDGAESSQTLVLDCAYAPLRLSGAPSLTGPQRDRVWQLYSPNKAMGLTGVRAAYAIAPRGAETAVASLEGLGASWPVGAHGVALLQAWVQPDTQRWLTASLQTLVDWKARQIQGLQRLGWTCLPSDANFFCARLPDALDLSQLRAAGLKLRDTASFGLPGHVRLGVLPPQAQDALCEVLCGKPAGQVSA